MHDREFLIWLLAWLHNEYGCSPGLDYMGKLASIIDRTHREQLSPNIASVSRVEELIRG